MAGGFKTFGAEVLTAADVNDLLMRQAVIRVATTTARDAIPSPEVGMRCFVTANGLEYQYHTTGWRVMVDSPTPAWTTITLGASWVANRAVRYRKAGDEVFLTGEMHSGTAGATIFTLPAGYLPKNRVSFLLTKHNTGTSLLELAIDTAGVAIIRVVSGTITAATPGYVLDGVRFSTV